MTEFTDDQIEELVIMADQLIGEVGVMRSLSDMTKGQMRKATSGLNPYLQDLHNALKPFERIVGVLSDVDHQY